MLTEPNINLREESPQEHSLIAKHFYQLWLDKKLTGMALDHLKLLNCTRVILHASPLGKPVYSSLGFWESNEMRLDLI